MAVLPWIIGMTVLNGLTAFAGAFLLRMRQRQLAKLLFILVAFSAGALLSGALFHLIAESLETSDSLHVFSYVLVGFVLFFVFERVLYWHHCHDGKCKTHPFTYLILFGDAIHNFVDGIIIAASFLVSIPFGIITSLIIIGHEIPQEVSNFGVLLHGGIDKYRALLYNFLAQLTSVIGGVVGYLVGA